MRKFFREILTDYDNSTYDTGRSLAVFVVLSMTVMQGWAVYKGGTFDPGGYGVGIAAVVAALGVAIFGDNAKRPQHGHRFPPRNDEASPPADESGRASDAAPAAKGRDALYG